MTAFASSQLTDTRQAFSVIKDLRVFVYDSQSTSKNSLQTILNGICCSEIRKLKKLGFLDTDIELIIDGPTLIFKSQNNILCSPGETQRWLRLVRLIVLSNDVFTDWPNALYWIRNANDENMKISPLASVKHDLKYEKNILKLNEMKNDSLSVAM